MKIIVVKKQLLIAVCLIVATGVILGVCCGLASEAFAAAGEKVIVIDAGHGGIDGGVSGIKSGTKESDVNLAIALNLKGYFADAGFKVVMTRKTNAGLYGAHTKGFKMRDMKKRKEIIETNKADMVISVHQNFCPVPSRRGAQVFYDGGSDCGKALAESIQNSLNEMKDCAKKSSPLAGDYYMLKCTENASVIVECGFLSNEKDEQLLIDQTYQKEIAFAIFKGAVAYFN